ncbi:tripartite tricarboxylate transporter substrate binding protein [Hydrogenophaga sp. A37]|uniref:tripartite tricarboxylate transporter substrate binding protein n=1 Tax=Hydrogenophaga sp. A37 TaxID=1945864 RepID=UPI00209B2890|nr:tripartite tricarboxylate transporter substrate binding protein [Hydrogenophaga sp. A37]
MSRRSLIGLGASLAAASALPRAWAQPGSDTTPAWPSKPLQLIVPWPAGGQTDLTLRILCEDTEPLLGQPIVVINKPGAAGTLVAPALKAAEPDGHTIGQVPITVYRHALMNHVPWDPVTDLAPIVQVSGVSFGLLVPASSPWKSATELIDWAIKHPGELILGSTGIGTTAHLAMEDILLQHNVSYVHVPYKGTADQMLAIAGAQIMAGVNSTGFAPWVDRGQLRLLATFNAARNPRWPDAPTMRELGYPQAVYTSPWGLAAPVGTPPAVIQKLHDVFHKAMYSELHTSALAKYDQSLDYLNTRDYRQAVLATVEREKKLLARMNLLAKPA